jgi:uncharacterized protein YhaN
MRLARLDLTRYGKFTSHTLDFGAAVAGQPDLHIVYGPNEAGKSTALAAFLDLLFGIETRSRYNFLHPYPTMRIGATLELAGGTCELVRVKRPQNNLLDANERPLTEGVLQGELGGVDREAYRAMFSLDDDTLESGGENILASKGDLGQLLFSASAGLADLSRRLVELRAEADSFYKFRARSGELAELKARLMELKEERARIDTMAAQFAQLVETRDSAAAQYDTAIKARAKIRTRLDDIGRLLVALPRLGDLRAIRERLAPLESLPAAEAGTAEDLPELARDEIELATRLASAADEIARLEAERDAIVTDEQALNVAERVGRLAGLRARHLTAQTDIPERRLQQRQGELAIANILDLLDRANEPEPKRLVLGAGVVGRLRGLIEARSGIESTLKTAESEVAAAQRRLDEALQKHEQGGGVSEAAGEGSPRMTAFAATVAAVRADDHALHLRVAVRERETRREELDEKLRDLAPWRGDVRELAELAAPSRSVIERWKNAVAVAQKKADDTARDIERLTAERHRLAAEAEAIGRSAGVVGDREAEAIRAERDRAWAEHRYGLDAVSADFFEEAMRRDDKATGARFAHTSELARLHQIERLRAVADADLGGARAANCAARATLDTIRAEIAVVFIAIVVETVDEYELTQVGSWLGRRDEALKAAARLDKAERELHVAEAGSEAARARLAAAFVSAGVPHDPEAPFDSLLESAQAAIDRDMKLAALREAVDGRRRDCADRRLGLKQAIDAEAAWIASWTEACKACWLGEAGVVPSIAEVREILASVAELAPLIQTRVGLVDRIDKMERDQAEFSGEVAVLAAELNIACVGDVLDVASTIDALVEAAKTAHALRADKEKELQRAQKDQRALAEKLALHEKRRGALLAALGVATLVEATTVLQKIRERTDLHRHEERAIADICEAARANAIEEAERALERADRATLEAERAELEPQFEDYDRRTRELFAEHAKAAARVESVGGDSAVANIEEQRRTLLLEIEEGAQQYLRMRLGVAAAEQALRIYRDRHRSSMMAHAGEAFRTISRGAYSGLVAQPDKDSEILVAIGADGGSKIASELSKGTRFQLYLAFRVAGYHEFAAARRPVPFVADDIMETFDDDRAEETFRLFSDMARVGQVIYLTHHHHLCDIAQRVCPTARVHRLPGLSNNPPPGFNGGERLLKT